MAVKPQLVDTNVLIRFFTGEPPAMAAKARRLVERADAGEVLLVVLPVIVAETIYTLESFYEMERGKVAEKLLAFLESRGVEAAESARVNNALRRCREQNAHFADAYLAAAALELEHPTDSFKQELKIVGVEEARRLSQAELAGWNILSIRGRMNEPLSFPGARSVKSLHFDDVAADCPENGECAAKLEDIRDAIAFSRAIHDGPLLVHCQAGISRSTAVAWIIIFDKLNGKPDAVRHSFDIVRNLRPILSPNLHVLRLGVEALVPKERRERIMQQFHDCLV